MSGTQKHGRKEPACSVEQGLVQSAVESIEQFGNGNFVDTSAMFEGLKIGNLTFIAVELELLKNL